VTPGDLPRFLVSAGVYLEREGKILILERAAGAMIGFWSLPSGLLDAGEAPEDGAIRLVYAAEADGGEVRLSDEHSRAEWIDPLEYRRLHLSDAEIERWRARDPKEATIVEAVRTTFDEYLAWRPRRA
jgi:8-oxo-dGTP pyrophosphatase MutT (NUDIX family)